MVQYNYKKGLLFLMLCFFIWGFQPLYWYLYSGLDTFFLMACRILFAALTCLVILQLQGKLPQLWAVFRDRAVLKREAPAALFLFADWIIYLWAVQNGRVLECSLGYYIQPLVVFFFGAVIFRERVSWRHLVVLSIVVVGIALSVNGFGGVPYVTIALAVAFAIYAAIKKSLTIDSIVSTTSEIVMMVPLALVYLLFFHSNAASTAAALTPQGIAFLVGGGIVTGVPMVCYAIGVRNLPLTTAGIGQYMSPTLAILCGMIMGEALTREKLISFLFIWLGVILYVCNMVYEEKHRTIV